MHTMITAMATSFRGARPDFHDLTPIGMGYTRWSTKVLAGTVAEYKAPATPFAGYKDDIEEAVVHCIVDTETTLTAPYAPEILNAARPRRTGPCHYVINATAYHPEFAAAFERLVDPDDTKVTLIDRSIMERYNEDLTALRRLAIAEHALNDHAPSHLFLYEIGDPRDVEAVSQQFGRAITSLCEMVMDYRGDMDLAEGAKASWETLAEHDYDRLGQTMAAIIAMQITIGAVKALFPAIGVDQAVTDQTLGALLDAIDVLDPGPTPD